MNYPELERCIQTIKALRHPVTGCPWDLEQTHETLLKYLIEESFEYIEAVENKDPKQMEEELGDVLLQILLHSTIAEEKSQFNLESVAKTLADKMIKRHPHVFSDAKAENSKEVLDQWKLIKEKDKKETSHMPTKLLANTALRSALKIGQESTKVNFDWDNTLDVFKKVEEEFNEMKHELVRNQYQCDEKVKEELGDLFFSLSQLARHLKLDPEEVARSANKKFITRFQLMEQYLSQDSKDIKQCELNELDQYWVRAKKKLKNG